MRHLLNKLRTEVFIYTTLGIGFGLLLAATFAQIQGLADTLGVVLLAVGVFMSLFVKEK